MKTFGGPAFFLDKNDINTDEIIPAKYLTETSKKALQPHLLEDLVINDRAFDPHTNDIQRGKVVISRANFGCGSSREHAVWVFEVNKINLIIAESFARIFRQNMFNVGILAITLTKKQIDALFAMRGKISITIDIDQEILSASSRIAEQKDICHSFSLEPFDKALVKAGGWLNYAAQNY